MSRGSALARVIGLTKSLSPLSHGRAAEGSSDADRIVAGAIAEEAQASPAPLALVEATTDAVASADAPTGVSSATADPKATETTLARVTLVAAETASPPTPIDPVRQAVTAEAIDAIEADIASLLSSLDSAGATPPRSMADDEDEGLAEVDEDDVESATTLLLSELDRLWRADPAIGRGSYLH